MVFWRKSFFLLPLIYDAHFAEFRALVRTEIFLLALTGGVMGITVNSAVGSVQTCSESKQRAARQTEETFHTTLAMGRVLLKPFKRRVKRRLGCSGTIFRSEIIAKWFTTPEIFEMLTSTYQEWFKCHFTITFWYFFHFIYLVCIHFEGSLLENIGRIGFKMTCDDLPLIIS